MFTRNATCDMTTAPEIDRPCAIHVDLFWLSSVMLHIHVVCDPLLCFRVPVHTTTAHPSHFLNFFVFVGSCFFLLDASSLHDFLIGFLSLPFLTPSSLACGSPAHLLRQEQARHCLRSEPGSLRPEGGGRRPTAEGRRVEGEGRRLLAALLLAFKSRFVLTAFGVSLRSRQHASVLRVVACSRRMSAKQRWWLRPTSAVSISDALLS